MINNDLQLARDAFVALYCHRKVRVAFRYAFGELIIIEITDGLGVKISRAVSTEEVDASRFDLMLHVFHKVTMEYMEHVESVSST